MGLGCMGGGGCCAVRSRGREDPTPGVIEWEVRPGGMLVQKREEGEEEPLSRVAVRVSFGAARMLVSVAPRATFGELKKLLSVETGLQPEDQRLIYKGKERENSSFLDLCGVKNRSKVTLVEDACSIERRYIEVERNAKIQKVQRAISDIGMEIDKLADQVAAIEERISNGTKVAEVQMTTLNELLMRHAIQLDGIPTEGDACFQKDIQMKRVQKCVEALDVLTVSNARLSSVVAMTKWETFDSPIATKWEFFD